MPQKLYILDVDVFLDSGGAGKASYDIILGLTNYYRIFFIPKYASYRKLTKTNISLFTKDLNHLEKKGVEIPDILKDLSSHHNLSYKKYLEMISSLIDNDSIVMDLNYFPEIEPGNFGDIVNSFFHQGEINYLKKNNNSKIITLLQTLDNRPIKSHIHFAMKSFLTFHFLDLKLFLKSFYRTIKDPLSTNWLMKNADLIMVYSQGSIISLNQKFMDKFKILKIGNNIKYTVNVGEKSDYIVYFSRLIYEKGILDLIEIFKIILKSHDADLVITGRFYEKETEYLFFNRIKKLGLTNRIKFLGYIQRQDLDKVISNAKVFLYPSHYDSFPYAILESMSLSTAVITYSLPTISYAFNNLDCVFLIKEFDIYNMAYKTIEVLKLDIGDYNKMFDNLKTKNFIAMHMKIDENINEINNCIRELLKKD